MKWTTALLPAVVFCLSACGQSVAPPAVRPTPAAQNGTANADTADVAEGIVDGDDSESPAPEENAAGTEAKRFEKEGITAEIASWEETQQIVAEHTGKVVVLDAWSTYCQPCLREFPGLVALQKKHPERVVCISFNLNYIGLKNSPPEADADMVLNELAKQKAALRNIISSTADEAFYEAVGDLASIPAVFVYGTDGTLKKRFDNDEMLYGDDGFTYAKDITPFVEQLLSETDE